MFLAQVSLVRINIILHELSGLICRKAGTAGTRVYFKKVSLSYVAYWLCLSFIKNNNVIIQLASGVPDRAFRNFRATRSFFVELRNVNLMIMKLKNCEMFGRDRRMKMRIGQESGMQFKCNLGFVLSDSIKQNRSKCWDSKFRKTLRKILLQALSHSSGTMLMNF